MPLESVEEWINFVKGSLKENDPLFKKDIFVSGRHEYKKLLLVENDSDNNHAIVSVTHDKKTSRLICKTIELIKSRSALAKRLRNDHYEATEGIK